MFKREFLKNAIFFEFSDSEFYKVKSWFFIDFYVFVDLKRETFKVSFLRNLKLRFE